MTDAGTTPDTGTTPDAGGPLTDAGPAHTDGGTCGGSLMQPATCESCIESMCCMQMTTCNATPGCPHVFECLHACSGSGTCLMDCLSTATTGISESSAVDGCLYMHCPPSCRAM